MAAPHFFWKTASRFVLALLFFAAGALHFLAPGPFIKIVPPFLPWPAVLVAVSGGAEILGAVGLLASPWRRVAAWGLALLLLAVFPANIYMAVAHIPLPGLEAYPWAVWARLPLQFVLIAWVLLI